jgi:uncharacterized protein Usg
LIAVDSAKIDRKTASDAVSKLQYFVYKYDLAPFQPYLKKDIQYVTDSLGKLKSDYGYESGLAGRQELRNIKYTWLKKQLGLGNFDSYYYGATKDQQIEDYEFSVASAIGDIKGYDILYQPDINSYTVTDSLAGIKITQVKTNADKYALSVNNEHFEFNEEEIRQSLMKNIKNLARYKKERKDYEYKYTYSVPAELLSFTRTGKNFDVKIQFDKIEASTSTDYAQSTAVDYGYHVSYLIKQK